MLFYTAFVSAFLALSQITAALSGTTLSQSNPGNHQQYGLLQEPRILREPAPVYENEVLLVHNHAPVASYSPFLSNPEPLVKVAPLINYAPLADQKSVLAHHELAPITHSATILHHAAAQPIAQEQDYDGTAHYEFSYSVDDDHTGDHKSQHETRHGDVVTGEYQLQQPDGSVRKVEYSADQHSGFTAVVHHLEAPKRQFDSQH